MTTAPLDHVVINVRFGLDRAAEIFAALGFTVTPRGYHTLGSINHLMVFGDTYLELLGLRADAANSRPELASGPVGINGLALRSDDADATSAELATREIAAGEVQAFSRPVDVDGGQQDARFRTVRLADDGFGANRVFYCQHLTPRLVRRPEWLTHANGVHDIVELVVVSPSPQRDAELYARAAGAQAGSVVNLSGPASIAFLDPAGYRERFGITAEDGAFQALVLAVADVAAVRALISARAGIEVRDDGDRLLVGIPELHTTLQFQEVAKA